MVATLINANANHSSASGSFLAAGGTQGNLLPGDVIIIIAHSARSTPRYATGMGAVAGITFDRIGGGLTDRFTMWRGLVTTELPANTTSGIIWNGGTPIAAWTTFTFRGVASTTPFAVGFGTGHTMPAFDLVPGQVVGVFARNGTDPFPATQTPAGWSGSGSGGNLLGAAKAVTAAVPHRVTTVTPVDMGWVVLGLATPDPPENLTAVPEATAVALSWDAPSSGIAPDGYTVSLDGAPAVDVGNVLTYSFDGLVPETFHTVQVWAYAAGGSSAPASVDFTTLALPAGYYRAMVELGPHQFTAELGDPPELGVALPISFGWSMADDANGYPAQLEVGTASLLLVIADGAEIAGVDVGTWMRVRVWVDPGAAARPVATFVGRVADYEIEPHEHGIGVRLLGADYTADLAGGGTVGNEPWPAESGDARAARIMAEAGVGWTSDPIGNVLEERAGQPAPAANVLRETLTAAARVAAGPATAPGRVILTPNVNAAGQLEPAAFRGTFIAAESTAIDKVPTAVHRRATWRRNRITDGRWVHIDHPGGPTVYGDRRGTPRPRLAVPVYDTDALADLALGVTPAFSWVSGSPLRLDLQHPDAPTAAVADWLWRDPASPPVPGAGRVVRVAVCDAMPGMFTSYAGMLAGVQFTLEPGGRRYIDFRLRPDVPAYSTVTPRWMDEPAGATWADELPGADWYSLRTIERGADYLEHLTP